MLKLVPGGRKLLRRTATLLSCCQYRSYLEGSALSNRTEKAVQTGFFNVIYAPSKVRPTLLVNIIRLSTASTEQMGTVNSQRNLEQSRPVAHTQQSARRTVRKTRRTDRRHRYLNGKKWYEGDKDLHQHLLDMILNRDVRESVETKVYMINLLASAHSRGNIPYVCEIFIWPCTNCLCMTQTNMALFSFRIN